jgi:hypothetical protein
VTLDRGAAAILVLDVVRVDVVVIRCHEEGLPVRTELHHSDRGVGVLSFVGNLHVGHANDAVGTLFGSQLAFDALARAKPHSDELAVGAVGNGAGGRVHLEHLLLRVVLGVPKPETSIMQGNVSPLRPRLLIWFRN